MPRRMSCSITVDAVRARTKTVTRRHASTWATLKPGDRLTLIEKGMGLKRGEKQVVLAEVEVEDVLGIGSRRAEFLNHHDIYTAYDLAAAPDRCGSGR